jgi:hypothetical protein
VPEQAPRCRHLGEADFNAHGPFDLEARLLPLRVGTIRLVDALRNTGAANHIAGQLLRCGTSAYGNQAEAEAAEFARRFSSQIEDMSEPTEGDSSLPDAARKIFNAAGTETDSHSQ